MIEKRVALVPAYEPDEKMLLLLKELADHGYEMVIVNDGSNSMWDDLFREAREYGRVLIHNRNRGKGAAIKTGLSYIREHYDQKTIVVTVDADGQHAVRDVEKVCAMAGMHPESLILGSRCFAEGTPVRSKFGNTVTRWVYKIFTGQKVSDTQTGLRAFTADWIPAMLAIQGDRYEYEMNVLMYCAKYQVPMIEVPIETIYLDGNASSHFDTLKDSARIYREIMKFFAASFLSFLVDYGFYMLFLAAAGHMEVAGGVLAANVMARVISASVNYTLNRRVVFDSDADVARSAVRYAVLAACILAVNTGGLYLLTGVFGMDPMISKLAVEMTLFIFNFIIQRTVIFPGREKNSQSRKVKTVLS